MADNRVQVIFRTYPQSMVWFDALATEYQINRSQVLRAALFVARQHPDEMAKTITAMKEMDK
jgi:hypothetical protein